VPTVTIVKIPYYYAQLLLNFKVCTVFFLHFCVHSFWVMANMFATVSKSEYTPLDSHENDERRCRSVQHKDRWRFAFFTLFSITTMIILAMGTVTFRVSQTCSCPSKAPSNVVYPYCKYLTQRLSSTQTSANSSCLKPRQKKKVMLST
jgi:hypothetical protein